MSTEYFRRLIEPHTHIKAHDLANLLLSEKPDHHVVVIGDELYVTTEEPVEPVVLQPFHFLMEMTGERIAELIENETPQVQALVLCHFEASFAAAVIKTLKRKDEIAARIAEMRYASPEIVREVERVIERKVFNPQKKLGGPEFIRHPKIGWHPDD